MILYRKRNNLISIRQQEKLENDHFKQIKEK